MDDLALGCVCLIVLVEPLSGLSNFVAIFLGFSVSNPCHSVKSRTYPGRIIFLYQSSRSNIQSLHLSPLFLYHATIPQVSTTAQFLPAFPILQIPTKLQPANADFPPKTSTQPFHLVP
ncbi:hypothetical protein D6D28_10316 [Aureobasidium pullulans]|uniref:Uncharacterized protein n=1 Tax=Aureobasidium pullulans TaxID=5580 RepID=A0A4S8RZB9_AURPU|nr:hypothetical protein D6D28_10316 [Aureobasidium pullulans]